MNTHEGTGPKDWLVHWFAGHKGLTAEEVKAQVSLSYFDAGWLDSFEFITFILEIEQKFGIQFSNDDLQNWDFQNIDGLAKIIDRKIGSK